VVFEKKQVSDHGPGKDSGLTPETRQ